MISLKKTQGLSIPGLCFPGLSFPGLSLPGLCFSGLSFPGLSFPGLSFPGLRSYLSGHPNFALVFSKNHLVNNPIRTKKPYHVSAV